MITVVGVKFKDGGKVYHFDPKDIEGLKIGTPVIVETARGLEFGTVATMPREIKDEEVFKPLKEVVRLATIDDIKRHENNLVRRPKAIAICKEKIEKHQLDMKLVDVEYTFDNNKIIFYFTSDGRVDFRQLVKDLASIFKMRIELRQIGVRDEAKVIGGVGACGRTLCCASWLSGFQPVSIKMAKVQNLSLNPAKISGMCGRLMCCLKYENDTYNQLKKGMPEVNEKVKVKEGVGKVVDTNLLKEVVKIRLFTGEEDENGNEKLSGDILSYHKEQVKRLAPKKVKNEDVLEEVDQELKEQLQQLTKQ